VTKGISYRVLGTFFTMAVGFAMTRSTRTALLLGSAEFVLKVLLFWCHERVWARVRWGRHHQPAVNESMLDWKSRTVPETPTPPLFAPPPGASPLSLNVAPQPIYPPREG
jgi:uncharacterized membrane protein